MLIENLKGDLNLRRLCGWDDSYLYIFSEVRDDDHVNPHTDSESWQGDSLQVGIDSFNDEDQKESRNWRWYWTHQVPGSVQKNDFCPIISGRRFRSFIPLPEPA